MALEFRLPDIGEGLVEATVVRWIVPIGAAVGLDEPIVEMETDKAVVDIPAPRAGVVLHHGAAAGEVIAVDSILVVIGEAGEVWSPGVESSPSQRPAMRPAAAPIVGNLEEAETVEVARDLAAAAPGSARPPALPLVRRLATSLGVDLSGVVGTGQAGRITRQDVEAVAQTSGAGERVRMSATRLAIARNLTRSWNEIPHVTTFGEARAEGLLALRKSDADANGAAVPLEAYLMRLLVPILEEYRSFNAVVDGDDIVYRSSRDIGFAVDTPNGLLVAVVRDVANLSLEELGSEIVRLATAGRDRKITAAEMRGATFTISNIGAVGGRFGTPIIPFGTSAILSIGRADERPVVRDGELMVGREFPLSLSYDHRIIDGAQGRGFLASVIDSMEAAGS
jgi:pyruvate dehydrogenase E2 component (dihydrolipoamide acetyltransferase)